MRNACGTRTPAAIVAAFVVALGLANAAQAGVSSHALTAKVTVTFTDSTLRVSPVNPGSGTTTFVVLNKGKKLHVLAITGPGLKNVRSAKLAAGSRTTLTVKLRKGTYVLSDPVGLGAFTSTFLDVIQSAVLTAKGNGSEVKPDVEAPPMCGMYFTP